MRAAKSGLSDLPSFRLLAGGKGRDVKRNVKGRVLANHSLECMVASSDRVFRASLRGRLRLSVDKVLAGDVVEVEPEEDGEKCRIERVYRRTNVLVRPPLANVDQVIIVACVKDPEYDLLYIDRLLVQVEFLGVAAVLCINKADLGGFYQIERIKSIYERAGYPCIVSSAITGQGIPEITSMLQGKVTVLSGQSGVGKSRLLSTLLGKGLLVNELSRFGKGRHTTKWVTLFRAPGDGFVADTPGFSKLDLVPCEPEDLSSFFREFKKHLGLCYFPRCLHRTEEGCAVKEALRREEIPKERYESYLTLLDESIERFKRRYKK